MRALFQLMPPCKLHYSQGLAAEAMLILSDLQLVSNHDITVHYDSVWYSVRRDAGDWGRHGTVCVEMLMTGVGMVQCV